MTAATLDPHSNTSICVASSQNAIVIDIRNFRYSFSLQALLIDRDVLRIEHAHIDQTMDLEFNPNKPNQLCSSGKDGIIRIWDLRKAEQPLMEIPAHSHWFFAFRN